MYDELQHLLLIVEHIAGGIHEDNGVERAQALLRKDARIFRGMHIELAGAAQLRQRCNTRWNRCVPILHRLGKHQHRATKVGNRRLIEIPTERGSGEQGDNKDFFHNGVQ